MKNCFAGHSMKKIRTTPLHRRKRAKEEGLRGSGSVASGMYTIYGIPCFAAPSGGGFLGNRFEDIKMYLNLSYNSWLATDSDYFYDSRNRWLL